MSLLRRRKVSVDANVLMAAIAYKSTVAPKVIDREKERDTLVISNIILFQCTRQSGKKNCGMTEEQIRDAVFAISPEIEMVDILPVSELRKRYSIRDDSDLETLYSIDVTGAEIFITGDDDFFDPIRPPAGVTVRFIRPRDYLEEDD